MATVDAKRTAGVDVKRSSRIATMYARCDVEQCEFRPSACRTFALDLMKLIFLPATTYFAHSLSGRLSPSVQVRTPL
jgi:hypothetical protein